MKKLANWLRTSDTVTILSNVVAFSPVLWFVYQIVASQLPMAWRLRLSDDWTQQLPALVLCGLLDLGIIIWALARRQSNIYRLLAMPSLVAIVVLYPFVTVDVDKPHEVAKVNISAIDTNAPTLKGLNGTQESDLNNEVTTETLHYSSGLNSTGSVNVWLVKCIGGPMDGRRHPISTSPEVMMKGGVRRIWVADPSEYRQREQERKPGQIILNRRPDSSSVTISSLSLYELEMMGRTQFALRFLGEVNKSSSAKQLEACPDATGQT